MLVRFFNFLERLGLKNPFANRKEVTKFLILAVGAFMMMGAQWPIKILKDGLLVGEVGADDQPIMRFLSIFACLAISLIYGQLVSTFRRETVLYIIISILTVLGMGFYVLLGYGSMGITWLTKEYVVRAFYLYADAFAVLTIPTFWAFVNDVTTPDEAKRCYGLIVFATQVGGLITVLASRMMLIRTIGSQGIVLMSIFFLLGLAGIIVALLRNVSKDALLGYVVEQKPAKEKHNIPFLRGLVLLLASPYVAGILFLTAAPEILTSVLSFKWFKIVELSFANNKGGIVTFMFDYALLIQVVSCTFSLLGGFYYNVLGVRNCIIAYPLFLLGCASLMLYFPALIPTTICLAFVRGLHYALNKPAREILYIPTTKDVKYKSKAWIEVFGSRIFKATGSTLCKLPGQLATIFLLTTPLVWVLVASFVGKRYEESVKKNEAVV